jgi:hypothetical protein
MPNSDGNKILRKPQFEKVIKAMWGKAKEKFAKLNEDNLFTGKNEFTNGWIKNEHIISQVSNGDLTGKVDNGYFCCKDVFAQKERKVERLIVGIHNDIQIGTIVDSVTAFAVDIDTREVLKHFPCGDSCKVISYTNGDLEGVNKVIEIPIGQEFNTKVVFGIHDSNNKVAWINNRKNRPNIVETGNPAPPESTIIPPFSNGEGRWLGAVKVIGSDVPFKDLINKTLNDDNNYVHKTNPNFVTGETIFTNGYTTGGLFTINNTNNTTPMGGVGYYSSEKMRIPARTKLTKVIIGIDNSYAIGDKVNNIFVGIVNPTTKQVEEYFSDGVELTIQENTYTSLTCSKIVVIDVDNKVWDEDKLLIVGGARLLWTRRPNNDDGDTAASEGKPEVNTTRLNYSNSLDRYNGHVIAFGENVSLSSLVKDVTGQGNTITVTKANGESNRIEITSGGGTITSVNGQNGPAVTLTPTFTQNEDGKITLRLGTASGDITCMTEQDANNIVATFR